MPEVADARASRYAGEMGVSPQLAKELAASKELSAFFDACAKLHDGHQEMAALIVGGLPSRGIAPEEFVALVRLVESSSITRAQAKEALRESARTGVPVSEVVKGKRLSAVVDEGVISAVVDKVLAALPQALEEAREDKKAFSYLVGQVLKEEPRAQPGVVAKLLSMKLSGKKT